jgi:heat shock protein HslJ
MLITVHTVWLLLVVTTGGDFSIQSIHSTEWECEQHRITVEKTLSDTLATECARVESNL